MVRQSAKGIRRSSSKVKRSSIVRSNRVISWAVVISAIVTIVSGYGITRGFIERSLASAIHIWFKVGFVILAISHLILSLIIPFSWKGTIQKIKKKKGTSIHWIRVIQRISGWAIGILALLIVISGLDYFGLGIGELLPFSLHINYDLFLTILIIIHVGAGINRVLIRNRISSSMVSLSILGLTIASAFLVAYWDTNGFGGGTIPDLGTTPTLQGTVRIDSQEFTFDPTRVVTVRPDLFNPGFFSMFDVLVHLDSLGLIDLEYHFNESMNTHVIDSINGESGWWYYAYYDGGWRENNVFRMDHYPWKDKTTLQFFRMNPSFLDEIYGIFMDEVTRRNNNGGRLIIPQVIVRGQFFSKTFNNVEVTPHNLRTDVFKEGVITAIDVIMSLGDQGELSYELKWYESIGSAGIVKNYYIETINDEAHFGGCGWVYEVGSLRFRGFTGNHIHLPSDSRVLNSPEYEEWFWICIF